MIAATAKQREQRRGDEEKYEADLIAATNTDDALHF
jgi:hypothetical protein